MSKELRFSEYKRLSGKDREEYRVELEFKSYELLQSIQESISKVNLGLTPSLESTKKKQDNKTQDKRIISGSKRSPRKLPNSK